MSLAGGKHPLTGVPYDERGEPVFQPRVIVPLAEPVGASGENLTESVYAAARALREELKAAPARREHFSAEQLQAIEAGRVSPPGLTWHVAGDRASLQLVEEGTHEGTYRPTPWARAEEAEREELPRERLQAEDEHVEELAEEAGNVRRQPARLEQLLPLRPRPERPPPGVSPAEPLWRSYVDYWERRYKEMVDATREGQPLPDPPVYYEFYAPFRRLVDKAVKYEKGRAEKLREQTLLPLKERVYFTTMESPHLEIHLGVRPRGARKTYFVDQLAWDLHGDSNPLVEVFSVKQRDFYPKTRDEVKAQG
jgi:hypothetical protein